MPAKLMQSPGHKAHTLRIKMLAVALRRWPYFGQWGAPTFSWSSTLTMLAGAISAMVESVCADRSNPICSSCLHALVCGLTMHTTARHGVSHKMHDGAGCLVLRSWETTTQRRASAARPCRRQVSSPGLWRCRWGTMDHATWLP